MPFAASSIALAERMRRSDRKRRAPKTWTAPVFGHARGYLRELAGAQRWVELLFPLRDEGVYMLWSSSSGAVARRRMPLSSPPDALECRTRTAGRDNLSAVAIPESQFLSFRR